MRLNTFLNFGGNCEAAFRFYEAHLGGKITMMMRRAEQPDQPITWPGWEHSIQYAYMDPGETHLYAHGGNVLRETAPSHCRVAGDI